MNYGNLFSRSLRLTWQYKFLWLFGLFMGAGSYLTDFASGQLLKQLPDSLLNVNEWQTTLSQLSVLEAGGIGAGTIMAVVVMTLAFWLITTWGEAALIGAIHRKEQGKSISVQESFVIGYRLLGRFIAIDTLVFFPWFLVALTAMLVIVGLLLGVGALAYQQAALESLMGLTGLGLVCLLPLLCLLLPVGYLTFIFRTLAFRDSAVRGTGVRGSIHHTWGVVRQRWAEVLMVTVLLWGVNVGAGLLFSLVSLPVTAVSTFFSPSSPLASLLSLFDILLILPQTVLQTFITTFWTLAYLEIMNYE